MKSTVSLGPLNILFSGKKEYISLLTEEFSEQYSDKNIDVRINVLCDSYSDYEAIHYSGKGNMNFNLTTFHVDHNPNYWYEVKNLFSEGSVEINIHLKKVSLFGKFILILKGLKGVEHTTYAEFIKNQIASYSCIWSILAICLLNKNYSFIHAGILSRREKVIVLSGTGGCGKTSTVLELLSKHKFKYLAEDFGIISADGTSSPCLKTVSLFYSDIIHGNPIARLAVASLISAKRLRWWLLTKILKVNPIIKAKPSSFDGVDIPKNPLYLGYGVHLSRQNIDSFSLKRMPLEEYAYRSANASGRELKPLSEVLKLISANAPLSYTYWDDTSLTKRLENTYLESFRDVPTFELAVPHKASPQEVTSYILSNLDI